MADYVTTRPLPPCIADRVLTDGFGRSVQRHERDNGTIVYRAHRSEIGTVRRAIQIARAWYQIEGGRNG
jgi:hypothetical protein